MKTILVLVLLVMIGCGGAETVYVSVETPSTSGTLVISNAAAVTLEMVTYPDGTTNKAYWCDESGANGTVGEFYRLHAGRAATNTITLPPGVDFVTWPVMFWRWTTYPTISATNMVYPVTVFSGGRTVLVLTNGNL